MRISGYLSMGKMKRTTEGHNINKKAIHFML